jgi:O-acetyl-ADP-ribose deacetylase (regulator of RNase III)
MVRNRATHEEIKGDDWQLEMLCNIGAAELLMPIGSVRDLECEPVKIDGLVRLRQRLQVSTEALSLRAVRLTRDSCCLLSFSRRQMSQGSAYYLDYAVPSMNWRSAVPPRWSVSLTEVVGECTAIGWTAKGHLTAIPGLGTMPVECVGIPPYPGEVYPRVLTLLNTPQEAESSKPQLRRLLGDATKPRGKGKRIVAQIVNDKAHTWGAGFALAVRKKWPHVQEDFKSWATGDKSHLALGSTRVSAVDADVSVMSMVAQHGYGPSPRPRVRYGALMSCLDKLAELSVQIDASVHMPRIGCGEAGGDWHIVQELINESLCRRGVQVTVYELPDDDRNRSSAKRAQLSIFGDEVF